MLVENGDRIVLNYLPDGVCTPAMREVREGMWSASTVSLTNPGVVMLLVVQMFRMAWTPFALQHAREPKAPQLFSRALTGLTLVCSAVFLAVALFLPVVVRIPAIHNYVKPGYWAGLPIVPIILLGYILSGVYAVVTTQLYIERRTSASPGGSRGRGREKLNLVICSIAARHSGLIGVAWATPAAYGLMALLGAWYSGRVFAVPFESESSSSSSHCWSERSTARTTPSLPRFESRRRCWRSVRCWSAFLSLYSYFDSSEPVSFVPFAHSR